MYSLSKRSRGFTLVELVVSVSIMALITTIVVMNQSHYSEGAALKSVADNISLSLREAQIYGISVRETGAGTNDFNEAYGVEFNITGNGSRTSYVSFVDSVAKNGLYGGTWSCAIGAGSECLGLTTLTGGTQINSLCTIPTSGAESCDTPTRVDITFIRPATQARIYVNGVAATLKGVRIKLSSASGAIRSVVIYTTGQISVQ